MDFSIHNIKSEVFSYKRDGTYIKNLDASYLIHVSFIARAKSGKETEGYAVFKYYDDHFYEAHGQTLSITHHKYIRSHKIADHYDDIFSYLRVELMQSSIIDSIKAEDAKYQMPGIKIIGHEDLRHDNHTFSFTLDDNQEKVFKMEVNKNSGVWKYWVGSNLGDHYPSNIRKHVFEIIKNMKPYRTYFLYN